MIRVLGPALLAVAACLAVADARAETLYASFYGAESGARTASGARFSPMGFSMAHRSLPFGTKLKVCFRSCAIGVVNDRGPALWTGRSLDLSRGLARRIGLEPVGLGHVFVTRVR